MKNVNLFSVKFAGLFVALGMLILVVAMFGQTLIQSANASENPTQTTATTSVIIASSSGGVGVGIPASGGSVGLPVN